MTDPQFLATRRRAYLAAARYLAPIARRRRRVNALQEIRHIGAQLNALDPASTEAPDVLDACATALRQHIDTLGIPA